MMYVMGLYYRMSLVSEVFYSSNALITVINFGGFCGGDDAVRSKSDR